MADKYADQPTINQLTSGRRAAAITKSDSTVLEVTRAIYVGTGGDVAVLMVDDTSAVTFPNVQTGTMLELRVTKVMSTNTTASNMVAIW